MSAHSQIAFRNRLISLCPRLADAYQNYRFSSEVKRWREKGWTTPLPSLIKRFMIKAEARRLGASGLVETGTYLGDTPWFFRNDFTQIISLEVEPTLAQLAVERFKKWPNVTIVEGDSASVLRQIVPKLKGPTVFWLDGHYSSGITGKGEKECPIIDELLAIFDQCGHPYSLLIDDARLFGKDPAYPTIPALEQFLVERRKDYQFRVENDVIFFTSAEARNAPAN